MKVGDLVEHKQYGLGIIVEIFSYEQYIEKTTDVVKHDGWIDLFPLVSITVFEPIHFEVGDGNVKSQSTFVIDQKEIREGELEVVNESR